MTVLRMREKNWLVGTWSKTDKKFNHKGHFARKESPGTSEIILF